MHTPNPPAPEWFTGMWYIDRRRFAACLAITDQARYADVMLADESKDVRKAALARVTDRAALLRASKEEPDDGLRAEAVRKLDDQEYLLSLVFSDPSEDVRFAAAETLTDGESCYRLAVKHPNQALRLNAVANVTDQEYLSRIILETDDKDVRREAAKQITDPAAAEALFRALPENDDTCDARALLVYAMEDQSFLEELALKANGWKIRRAAASRLKDQDLLMKIIKDQEEFDLVRGAAAGAITDQETLRELADTYYHKLAPYDIGEEALKHIEDQEYLKSTAEDYGLMHCLRQAAAEHVTDQRILFTWGMEESSSTVHDIGLAGIAVRRLTEPEYLARIAVARADMNDLSERAIERLHDDKWLLWIISELGKQEDADDWWNISLRGDAALKMKDPSPLVELALQECNDEMDIGGSFELSCVCAIAESPSAMRDYASRFTNGEVFCYALDYTLNRYGLEGFLENPALTESERSMVLKKIGKLERLSEIGMAEKAVPGAPDIA